MGSLKRFTFLPWTDQALLMRTLTVVAAIRLGLWLLPFHVLRSVVLRSPEKEVSSQSRERLIWAVAVVSRYIPRATCLTQALAAQALLARHGYESKLELGVAKDLRRKFEAHAWLVCGDQVVLGGPTVDRYTPLAAWKAGP